MSIGLNIKKLREVAGLSQVEFAKIAGVSDKAVSTWENDNKTPRMGTIQKIAEYFGISKSQIIDDLPLDRVEIQGTESFSTYKPKSFMPKLGRVAAGMPIFAEDNIECYIACDYNDEYQYYALTVHGDSMNAAGIDDGDIVIVRQQDVVDTNQIAVVLVNGYDATIKYYHQSGKTVILTPKSYNTDHQPQIYDASKIAIKIIGRVVEVRKSL